MPGKVRLTQVQRMYQIVKSEGVEAAIEWFKPTKNSGWGGANWELANQLIKDGRVDDGMRLMEFDVETSPRKVWLLRKTALAHLNNGHPRKANCRLTPAAKCCRSYRC
ncbi:hypothetical protein [Novipirellula rosea]|uniref:Uncharacterized protein n=1 Tax=Novipirellula rosea TaxID=1031540 RepID=A0ABP8NBI9_9BACT